MMTTIPYSTEVHLAIVADWLTTIGGAERTLAEFHALWKTSPMFTTVTSHALPHSLRDADIRTTRLQPLYRLLGRHQLLLPLMPRAVEDIDLREYDVIVSSSHAVGKGIIPPSTAVHVCYCHTPMRYAWEMERQYIEDFRIPTFLRKTVQRRLRDLRRWDLSTAKRVDAFIANSSETAGRIERIYGRPSVVIPPPAQDHFFAVPLIPMERRTSYLVVSRLVPYKRVDLAIECCNRLGLPLLIAGTGQQEKRLRAMAGPTVRFLGRVGDEELPTLYASSKAVLFTAHEDAGIVPLEAQACGTPVIAYGKGGALDTVRDSITGVFFREQHVSALENAVRACASLSLDPAIIREHASQFSSTEFRRKIRDEVQVAVDTVRRAPLKI